MAEVKKRLCLCLILITVAAVFIGGAIFWKSNSGKEQKKMKGTLVLVERVTEWR